MYIPNSAAGAVEQKTGGIGRLLTLRGASVLEQGCGRTEKLSRKRQPRYPHLKLSDLPLKSTLAVADFNLHIRIGLLRK